MEQNNQQQGFKCTGNCLNCLPGQRAYCASQHAYSNMKVLDTMMAMLLDMRGSIKDIYEKIAAIQDNEAMVFDPDIAAAEPLPTENDIHAQIGDGAESRSPEIV